MKKRGTICALFAFGALHATAAFAQDQVWLKDRRYTEGIGYRAGDIEIHPGVAAEVGYDSNYFLRAPDEQPIDAMRLRLTPSLSISTISPQRREAAGGGEPPKVNFRAGVAATYNEFIALHSKDSDAFSKQRNVGGLANLQLTILPQRPWGGDVYADFLRMVQPSTNPDAGFNRVQFRAGAGIVWTPGGGMFDWRLGYEYALTYFEETAFQNLNNTTNQINTRGRWRFLPRTAFLYDANIGFVRYTNRSPQTSLNDSNPVRARLGLNGLITPSFALLAMAGWGSSFYAGTNPQQFDSVIGQVELKWFITPNPSSDPQAATLTLSSVAIGYTRDFVNSYIGDYYTRDRGYANISYFFSGRFLAVLDGGVSRNGYPTVFLTGNPPQSSFTIIQADASAFGEYRVADSFGINATLRYSAFITDERIGVLPGDNLAWKRFEAYLGARWFM